MNYLLDTCVLLEFTRRKPDEKAIQWILPLETQTMFLWGSLTARMEKSGQPMAVMDSLIVATALQNNLIIATRNVSDFLPCGVQVINPWE
jgi:toxin FitB